MTVVKRGMKSAPACKAPQKRPPTRRRKKKVVRFKEPSPSTEDDSEENDDDDYGPPEEEESPDEGCESLPVNPEPLEDTPCDDGCPKSLEDSDLLQVM